MLIESVEFLRELARTAGTDSPYSAQACGWAANEIERLRTPTAYWDDRHLDAAIDPSEVVAYDDVGDIVELRPIHELPTVWALVTDSGPRWFNSREAAEKGVSDE